MSDAFLASSTKSCVGSVATENGTMFGAPGPLQVGGLRPPTLPEASAMGSRKICPIIDLFPGFVSLFEWGGGARAPALQHRLCKHLSGKIEAVIIDLRLDTK